MPDSKWHQIEAVFLGALERDQAGRAAFLDEACADDPTMREEIEAMLVGHAEPRELVVERLLDPADAKASPPAASLLGERVGAYRLEELIGQGGMGEVYLGSRDDEQYVQQIAVKVARGGHRGADLTARLLQERQILARLVHPNIATLVDGGVTADGRPYIVMEHVEGVPLTEYCDTHRLGIRERLELFREVCEAVRFAHVHLVVHRDLKPPNILVTADGRVKLLDFGIAKLLADETGGDQSPHHAVTHALERVLTPEHAAPEQVRGEPVTTATDVHALGILLYELLTGVRPFRFEEGSTSEIERVICETEPVRPSLAVARIASEEPASAGRIAACRGLRVEPLRRALRGELDKMVLVALRKEPERRYPSAQQLDEDIERWLRGLPVSAETDSFRYRTGKFVRRNRILVTSVATVAVLVLGFSVVTAVQAVRLEAQRDRARVNAERAERIVDVLVDLFRTSEPAAGRGDTLSVAEFLDIGEAEIDALTDQPNLQARLWRVLGNIQSARTGFARAKALYEKALAAARKLEGPESAEIDFLDHELARVIDRLEGSDVAEPLFRRSLQRLRERLGPRHPDVADAMQDLGAATSDPEESLRLLAEALALKREILPAGDSRIASALNALARLRLQRAEYEASRTLFREALDILGPRHAPTHPSMIQLIHNLGVVHTQLGEWEAAEGFQRQTLEARRKIYGEDTVPVAASLESLGAALANLGDHAGAETSFRDALRIFEKRLGPFHRRVSNAVRNVGRALDLQGKYAEALPLLDRALGVDTVTRGARDPNVVYRRGQRGMVLLGLGRDAEALAAIRSAGDQLADGKKGSNPDKLADAREWLGTALLQTGEPVEAEQAFREALELRRATLPKTHPKIAAALCGLGAALAAQGRDAEAEPLLRDAREAFESWGLASALLRQQVTVAVERVGVGGESPE